MRRNREYRSKRTKTEELRRRQERNSYLFARGLPGPAPVPASAKKPEEVAPVGAAREVNFVQVCTEILQSVCGGTGGKGSDRLRRMISNLAQRGNSPHISLMAAVFWPTVWSGVWKQFCLDVPRSQVHYQGECWDNPFDLFHALERDLGVCWSRWYCVFINQSPMADVLSRAWRDAQQRCGDNVILCEGGPLIFTVDRRGVKMEKRFLIRRHSEEILTAMNTTYQLYLDQGQGEINWQYD